MANGPRGGGGWSDDPPEWMGLGAEGPVGPRGGRRGPPRQGGYDEGWGRPAPRGRPAVHDPWNPRRRVGISGLPVPPAWLGGVVVVLFAFLLGRCTAGGGDDETTATTTSTIPAVVITTVAIQTTHTVQENEVLAEIASRYGVTIEAIAAANPELTDINDIFEGQVLKIPAVPTATTVPATTTTTKKKGN